jgi:hypothetical protein
MQASQLGSGLGQGHFSRTHFVTGGTTKFLKALNSSKLRRRTLILGHLGDDGHRFRRGDASLESLPPFLAFLGEAELSLIADSVALPATLSVKKMLG